MKFNLEYVQFSVPVRYQNEHIEGKIWYMHLKLKGEFWNRGTDLVLWWGNEACSMNSSARIKSLRGIL